MKLPLELLAFPCSEERQLICSMYSGVGVWGFYSKDLIKFSNSFSISDEIWILELHLCTFSPYWSLTSSVIRNSCIVPVILCTPERIWGWSSPGSDQTQATTAVIPGIFLHSLYFQEMCGFAGPASAADSFPVSDADCKKALLGWDSPLELGIVHMSQMTMLTLKSMTTKGKPKSLFLYSRKQKPKKPVSEKKKNLRKTRLGGKIFSCPEDVQRVQICIQIKWSQWNWNSQHGNYFWLMSRMLPEL